MKLFPDENILQQFGSLMLTNYRVRSVFSKGERNERIQELISIRLEHVTDCRVREIDFPGLILLGILVLLATLILGAMLKSSAAIIIVFGLFLGSAFIFLYFYTRQSELVISSPTATIKSALARKNFDDAIEFVNYLEFIMAAREKTAV
jgi:hypothetical protein